MGLIFGVDLCDDSSQISIYRSDSMSPEDVCFEQSNGRTAIQTALGLKDGQWLIGQDAYMAALEGSGVVIDRLLSRMIKNESFSYGDELYTPERLIGIYIAKLLEAAYSFAGAESTDRLVFTVEKFEPAVLDGIIHCMEDIGIDREKVHVISHNEAYLYYVLSQDKNLWINTVALFDWSAAELHYYELNVIRGKRPNVVKVTHQLLRKDLSQDDLGNESKQRLVDSVLSSLASGLLAGKVVSGILLCGKAMESCKVWGRSFTDTLCRRGRRVAVESNIFSKGAAYVARDEQRAATAYPYTIICEGRVNATVWIEAVARGSKSDIYLAAEGSNWYESRSVYDLILDGTDQLRVKVMRSEDHLILNKNIDLSAFPKRPDRTTRIKVIFTLISQEKALIRVIDMGFGDFFPASGLEVKTEISID